MDCLFLSLVEVLELVNELVERLLLSGVVWLVDKDSVNPTLEAALGVYRLELDRLCRVLVAVSSFHQEHRWTFLNWFVV